jgi:hypothetical protein
MIFESGSYDLQHIKINFNSVIVQNLKWSWSIWEKILTNDYGVQNYVKLNKLKHMY